MCTNCGAFLRKAVWGSFVYNIWCISEEGSWGSFELSGCIPHKRSRCSTPPAPSCIPQITYASRYTYTIHLSTYTNSNATAAIQPLQEQINRYKSKSTEPKSIQRELRRGCGTIQGSKKLIARSAIRCEATQPATRANQPLQEQINRYRSKSNAPGAIQPLQEQINRYKSK